MLDSSASSVVGLEMTDGIMVQETDSAVDPLEALEEVASANHIESSGETSRSAQLLKEHLKMTLSTKPGHDGGCTLDKPNAIDSSCNRSTGVLKPPSAVQRYGRTGF